jgi:hypothetical protein
MTKITTVYDAIILKLGTVFSSKQRLFNPYRLLENPELVRKDSWGLRVDSAERVDLEYCNLSIQRTFTFILMRQFVTLAGKEDGFDAVSKSLLEDQQSFLNSFYATDQIGQGSNIESIDFTSISGIQMLEDEEKKYLYNEIEFTVTLNESVQ